MCKSRAPVPLALQPAGYAVAWRFASPVFGVRKVLEGRSRCEKQRIPIFCRLLAANFVLLSNFGKSLPLSTVVFAFQKRTSDNIFDSNMLLKHVSARMSIMWVQKAFSVNVGGEISLHELRLLFTKISQAASLGSSMSAFVSDPHPQFNFHILT